MLLRNYKKNQSWRFRGFNFSDIFAFQWNSRHHFLICLLLIFVKNYDRLLSARILQIKIFQVQALVWTSYKLSWTWVQSSIDRRNDGPGLLVWKSLNTKILLKSSSYTVSCQYDLDQIPTSDWIYSDVNQLGGIWLLTWLVERSTYHLISQTI